MVPLALAYIKVTRLNISIISWAGWAWINLQLPMALLSIVLMGAIYAVVDAIPAMVRNVVGEGTFKVLDAVFTTLASAVAAVAQRLLGIDLASIGDNAGDILAGGFIAVHFVILAIGLLTLMSCYFLYTIKFIRCLSGKGSTGKMLAFLVAIIGYSLPFFNIFPWFIFWVIAVWRYPK